MLQKTDIVSYRLTNEELQLCCTNAKKAAINGYSHIRSKADRTLHLEQDQLIGQIGEYVGHMILFNSCDGYLKSRALANANPYQGDSGTDVIDQHIDFKTSRLSLRGLPISQHNLVVRPHEKHDNTTYILILVDSTMSRAYVVGYAHTSELPKDVNKTGILHTYNGGITMNENRSAFDWIMFLLIHLILIGGIGYAGFAIYGNRLGVWVAASAAVAGLTSTYLYAKIVPGETIMKVLLGLSVAANAAYMVHNGAKAIGISAFNDQQIRKYEAGMAAAAGATTRTIARSLGASVKDATALEKTFSDGVSTVAALLAFIEMSLAIIFFAVASKRVGESTRGNQPPQSALPLPQTPPAVMPQPATRGSLGFSTAYSNGNYTPTSTNGDNSPKD